MESTMKFIWLNTVIQSLSTYYQKEFLAHFIELRKGVEILQYYTTQWLKTSITGDTAKILVFNSREVMHFHLKTQTTHGGRMRQDLWEEMFTHNQPDPFPVYSATSACLVTR